MNEFLDVWFMGVGAIIPLCMITCFIVVCLKRWKKRVKAIIALFFLAGVSFISLFLLEFMIKNEVSEQLGESSFIIESHGEFDEVMLLSALKNKRYISTHKTRPLEESTLRIVVNSGELELRIAQDSKYPSLYWVYYPKYLYSRGNELGKIRVR